MGVKVRHSSDVHVEVPRSSRDRAQHLNVVLDSVMALCGTRPAPLLEPVPQFRVERHVGEDSVHFVPMVQVLDVPLPLTMGEVFEVLERMQKCTVERLGELVPQQ